MIDKNIKIERLMGVTQVISEVSDKGLVKRGHRKHGRDIGPFIHLSGGNTCADNESLRIIRDAVNAGGTWVCIGRNAFQRNSTKSFVQALCSVVHRSVDQAETLEQLK